MAVARSGLWAPDHIWRAWYNGSHTMMAKPIGPMIQFLIIAYSPNVGDTYTYLLGIIKGSFIISLINLFIK